jgi:hypothetical protein
MEYAGRTNKSIPEEPGFSIHCPKKQCRCLKTRDHAKCGVTVQVDAEARAEWEKMTPWENGRTELSPFS